MKFKFYTCKIKATKAVSNLTYKVNVPSGVSIDSVVTSEGSDINYQVVGNEIRGIDIPAGESLILCIALKSVIGGKIDGYGEWCNLNVKKDKFCFDFGEIESGSTQFLYKKCTSDTKYYEVFDTNVFELEIPVEKMLEENSVCVYANGKLINDFTVSGTTVTTDEKFGEETDLCKITIKYSCCEDVVSEMGCYEKRIPMVFSEKIIGKEGIKICPTEGCCIDKGSISVFVEGIYQHSVIISCLAGDDEGCMNITLIPEPNTDIAEECEVTVKWDDKCLICGGELVDKDSEILTGLPSEKWCKDGVTVIFDICKLKDGRNQYKGTDGLEIIGGSIDLINLGYSCGSCNEKSAVSNYFTIIEDDQKKTWIPTVGIDTISVAVADPHRCNYVRVTYVCPDGVIGCSLITPTQPTRSISLKEYDQITEVCFEVVEKNTSGAEVKDWSVISPTTSLEINVDGLDIQ